MSITQEFTKGLYTPSEHSLLLSERITKPSQAKLIIVCHGRALSTQPCLQFLRDSAPTAFPVQKNATPHLHYLVNTGYSVLAPDGGGGLAWGGGGSAPYNDSLESLEGAIAWARAGGYCHPTKKVLFIGYSMGGNVAAQYIDAHPEEVAGFVCEAGGMDITYFYNNGYSAEINSAYGGNWTTNGVGHDPQRDMVSTWDTPTQVYVATDDSVVPYTVPQNFYNSIQSTNKELHLLPSGDHLDFWQHIDIDELYSWIYDLDWD
jgi:pimeloyl-ACP methyl ester carboxylesterase